MAPSISPSAGAFHGIECSSSTILTGCCFVAVGAYPAIGIGASWITTVHADYTKRATAFAVCQVFVQSYSIIGSQVYDRPPRFYKGHGVLLGLNALAAVCTWGLTARVKWEARRAQELAVRNPEQYVSSDGVGREGGEKGHENVALSTFPVVV